MSLWDEVKTNLLDLYTVTSDKTVEVARVSSRKYEKFGISRDIERQFSELGNLVYSGIQDGRTEELLGDESISGLVQRIAGLERDLKDKNEEIDRIKKDSHKPRAKAAAAGGAATEATDEQPETEAAESVENIITDPVLPEGHGESAILMDEGDAAETAVEPESEGSAGEENPKNEG